jgi:hypothetical protein
VTAVDAVGTEPAGATNGAIGSGVTAFRTKVPTPVGALDGTISIQIGAQHGLGGVGVINRSHWRALPPLADDPERRAVRTAADRAAEAIEAAEIMFAEEMGATLDLSPAAKMALIVKIAAAIEAAVAEETCTQGLPMPVKRNFKRCGLLHTVFQPSRRMISRLRRLTPNDQ